MTRKEEMGNDKVQHVGKFTGPMRRAKDPRHGTLTGYAYHKCRCAKCQTFMSQHTKEYRMRRFAALTPADHGKATTYINAGCRCESCREAHTSASTRKAKKNYKDQNKLNFKDLA